MSAVSSVSNASATATVPSDTPSAAIPNSAQGIDATQVKPAHTGTRIGGAVDSNVAQLLRDVRNPASGHTASQAATASAHPGEYRAMLNNFLGAAGGSEQLLTHLGTQHANNAKAVDEMNNERGGSMTPAQKKEEIARLDDAIAIDVMSNLLAFEDGGGTIGSSVPGEPEKTVDIVALAGDMNAGMQEEIAPFRSAALNKEQEVAALVTQLAALEEAAGDDPTPSQKASIATQQLDLKTKVADMTRLQDMASKIADAQAKSLEKAAQAFG